MQWGFNMSEKKAPKVLLSQLEDALEERQSNDRRGLKKEAPAVVKEDRRKQSRRDTPK
jgi:hypothetical protein